MFRVSLKSLWGHKRRMVGTSLAVLFGVAFLVGTLVLGDTMRASFDTLFADANESTDAVVRSELDIDVDVETARAPIDASLVDDVRAIDGVRAAEPSVTGLGQLLGADGERIGGDGPPTIAGNWIADPDLNPWKIIEGHTPERDNEVVIDRGAADTGDLKVGDTTTLATTEPLEVTVVGIATFGDEDSLGTSTFTALPLEQAQRELLGSTEKVTSVVVAAEPGVSQDQLVQSIDRVLPDGVEAISGTALTAEQTDQIGQDFLDLFRIFLGIFGGIALLVAAFSIHNTFTIVAAQRTREAALLRAVGAGQAQVLGGALLEVVVVGVLASVAGVLGGIGIAIGLSAMFRGFGMPLPEGGVTMEPLTLFAGLAVGVVVTLVAGLWPAIRAARIPPMAALRDVAAERTHASLVRVVTGAVLIVAGVGVVIAAVVGESDAVLAFAGIGALLTIVGLVVFGPVVAQPASRLLGLPALRLRGITGRLARENAMRSPRRTSGTAAALMVGVGIVTLFTVFAASLKLSIDESVNESFGGDLVISTGGFGGGGFSTDMATEVGDLSEVDTAVGLGINGVLVDGDAKMVTVTDPAALDRVLDLGVADGSVADLGDSSIAVADKVAEDNGWSVGDTVAVTFPDDTERDMTIGATYSQRDVAGNWIMPRAAFSPHAVQDIDQFVLVDLASGVSLADGKAAVESVAERHGAPEVQDREEYVDSVASQIDQMLALIYMMLFLAIVIALIGIANTLALSIHERTRELGLLRAVGLGRSQLRSMVRWESVIIAVFGTLGGVGLGLFLGWALVEAASTAEGIGSFDAPFAQLLVVVIVGAVAGVLAAIRPARRAAKLDVLQAIAVE